MKHNPLLVLFLLSHALPINGMEMPVEKEKESPKILFFQSFPCPRILGESIPSEIHDTIIFNSPSATFENSAQLIRNLSISSKKIATYFKKNMSPLIKQLSTRFKCSNEWVAKSLHMKAADKILFKQQHFAIMCTDNPYTEPQISPQDAIRIRKNNIDINFTYANSAETQLVIACSGKQNRKGNEKSALIKYLLENKADINIPNSSGITAPFEAAQIWWDGQGTQLIEYFWDHPDLKINEIRWCGYKKTLLMQILFFWKRQPPEYFYPNLSHQERERVEKREERQRLCRLKQAQELCNRGADPEIGHTSKRSGFSSAWTMAQASGDKDLIEILADAIAKKHIPVIRQEITTRKNDTQKKRAHKKPSSKIKQPPLPSPE